MNAGNLISPMSAGALPGACGLFTILVIKSISFILSSISEMFIDIPKVNKKLEVINLKSFNKDFKEGIMFIKNSKILFSVICIAVLVNFGGLLSIGFFIALIAMGVVNISISIMFQQIVPLDMMGRVGTVMNTGCMASMPLAQLIFGLLYDNIPTTICVLISAIIIIITMMVFKKSLLATPLKEKEAISLA